MAWQLLAAALPAAAKVAGTALSKPRQEDFAPQTDYMKKYLSYLRGRTSDREVMHLAMQPALRVAGKQGRQMQRQVGYDVAKSGLGGSGIEAQMRLSAGQQTQEALATATDKAVAAQAAQTARVGEQAAGITAQIGAEEARADQAFKSAESQWKRQLTSDVIGGVGAVAGAGIAQYGQNIAGFRQALTEGSVPAGTTYSQFKEMAKGGVIEGAPELGVPKAELGRMSPAEYAQYTGVSKEKISGLRLAERIYGSPEAVKNLRDKGISDADIISEAKRMQAMYVSAVGSGADPADINEAMRTLGFGNVTASYVDETEGEDPAVVEEIVSTEETGQAGAKRGEKGVERSIVSTTDEPPVVKEEPVKEVELPAGFIEGDYSTYPVKEFNGKPHHYDPRTGEAVTSTAIKPVAKEVKEIQELETVEVEADPAELAAKKAAEAAATSKAAAEKYAAKVKTKKAEEAALTVKKGAERAAAKRAAAKRAAAEKKAKEVRATATASMKKESEKQEAIRIASEKKIEEKQIAETKKYLAEQAELDVIGQTAYKKTKTELTKKAKAALTVKEGAARHRKKLAELAAKPDEKTLDAVVKTVTKFESGDRSERHNNPGAMVWSAKLQEEYPEIEKGDSFTKDGKTYYTAKFKDKATGERINKEIISKIWTEVGGDTLKFYSRWSGLPKDSATVKNYAEEIKRLTGA